MLKHRARDRLYKRAVGLLLLGSLVLVLLVMRAYQNTERFLGRSFALHAQAKNVNGLEVDAHVTMAGLKVGKVHAIDLMPDKTARLTMDVELRYQHLVRADSVATLTKPIIGATVLDIGIGNPSQPQIADGGEIALLARPDLGEVVASLPAKLERMDHALANLAAITDMARSSVQRLTAPNGALDAALVDARASAQNVRAATEPLKGVLTDVRGVAAAGVVAAGQAQDVLRDVRGFTAQTAGMGQTLQRTLGHAEELTLGLRDMLPQLGSAVHAAQGASEEADKVLRAASNSFLLGGPKPVPAAPLLISPRAP
ncbi:MAG: MCE family protein [Rhodoferax sp.]|nr:MCE family protein [Rhodoferax sp.]